MTRVWDETRFKGTDLLVLLCLADHANDDGLCWPSYDRLALRARCTRRQAIRCLERLISDGWVTRHGRKPVGRGGYVNIFRIGLRGEKLSPGDISSEGGDIFDFNGVTPMSPKPSLEPSKKNLVSDLHRTIAQSPSALPDLEEAETHVCETTSLPNGHAQTCAEKWLGGVQGKRLTDWRAHLSAFADKYECDYRR